MSQIWNLKNVHAYKLIHILVFDINPVFHALELVWNPQVCAKHDYSCYPGMISQWVRLIPGLQYMTILDILLVVHYKIYSSMFFHTGVFIVRYSNWPFTQWSFFSDITRSNSTVVLLGSGLQAVKHRESDNVCSCITASRLIGKWKDNC